MAVNGPLEGLDAQALRLIKDVANWKWHPGIYGFVNEFAVENQKNVTRAELVEHHLYGSAGSAERAAGIDWLKQRLEPGPGPEAVTSMKE